MRIVKAVYTGDKPGLNGEPICLRLEQAANLNEGDIITYDYRDGMMLIIDKIVRRCLITRVVTTSPSYSYFPLFKLERCTQYYKIERI